MPGEVRGLFVDLHVQTGTRQCRGGGKTAHASPDHGHGELTHRLSSFMIPSAGLVG